MKPKTPQNTGTMKPMAAHFKPVARIDTAGSMGPSDGEVEGPHDHASQRPRARNIDWVPRPQTTHASRPPPTIVRRQSGQRHPAQQQPPQERVEEHVSNHYCCYP